MSAVGWDDTWEREYNPGFRSLEEGGKGEREGNARGGDELACGTCSADLFDDIVGGGDSSDGDEGEGHGIGPILLQHGANDDICPPEQSRAAL